MCIRHTAMNLVVMLMSRVYRDLVIVNELGLHLRPLRMLVDTASGFASDIRIARGDLEVNGKSFFEILSMAVPMNTTLRFIAEGDDAEKALDALQELVESKFNEDHED